jgi:hypothetical protein
MTIADPIRLDRFQQGLVAFITDATGLQNGWAYGEGVYSDTFAGSYVNLTVDSGPTLAIPHARGTSIQPVTSIVFTVTAAVVGSLVAIYVNEIPYRVQVGALDTVDTLRTALVAAITADASGQYTATGGVGAGEWTLAPVSFGAIWSVRTVGSMSAVVTSSDELALVTQGSAEVTVSIEVFSKGRTPRTGAWALASKIAVAFQLPDYALVFRDWGFGVGAVGDLLDLSAIAGGKWESRVAFSVDFNLLFSVSRPSGRVTTAAIDAAMSNPLLNSSVEVAL